MATTLSHLIVKLDADARGLKKELTATGRALDSFADRGARAGKALTVGLTLPITAVGIAATKLATDAAETANKFDVVMGPAADRLRRRFEELHDIIPATRAEMEGLTSGVQDLLVPLGIARDEAANMSLAMLELGADIGSFNNVATPEVLNAFKSALAGQSRPLRQFGIDVSEARLKVVALEHGLLDAKGAMSTAARAQAVLLAATADSSDALGDSARTANDAANQFRFFVRNLKELATTIGDQLLPVVTPLVNRMNELVSATEGATNNTVQWGIAIGGALAVVGPATFAISNMTKAALALKAAFAITTLASGGIVVALAAITAGVGYLIAKFIKGKLEAAALKEELDGLAASQLGPNALAKRMDDTQAALDKATANARRLKKAVEAAGGPDTRLGRSLNRQFEEARNRVIALSAEMTRLRVRAEELSTVEMTAPAETVTAATKEASERMKDLLAEIDYFVNRGGQIELAGNFQAPIAEAVEFMDIGTQRIDAEFAKVEAIADRFGMALEDVIRHVEDPALRSALERRLPEKESGIIDAALGALSGLGPKALAVTAALETLRGTMEAIAPWMDKVREVLRTVGGLIGAILVPALQILVRPLQWLAAAVGFVVEMFGRVVLGIAKLLDKIPGVSTGGLQSAAQGMIDAGKAAQRLHKASDDAADGLNRLTASLTNAVRGFKVAAYAHGATAIDPAATPTKGDGARPGPVDIGGVTINTSGDGRETYRKWYDEVDQRTRGAGESARAFFRALPEPV